MTGAVHSLRLAMKRQLVAAPGDGDVEALFDGGEVSVEPAAKIDQKHVVGKLDHALAGGGVDRRWVESCAGQSVSGVGVAYRFIVAEAGRSRKGLIPSILCRFSEETLPRLAAWAGRLVSAASRGGASPSMSCERRGRIWIFGEG